MDTTKFEKLFSEITSFKQNPFHPLVCINGKPKIGKNVYIGIFRLEFVDLGIFRLKFLDRNF